MYSPIILVLRSDCGRKMCLIIVFRSRAGRRSRAILPDFHVSPPCLRRWFQRKCTKAGNSKGPAESKEKNGFIARILQNMRDLATEDDVAFVPDIDFSTLEKDVLPPYEEGGVFGGQ